MTIIFVSNVFRGEESSIIVLQLFQNTLKWSISLWQWEWNRINESINCLYLFLLDSSNSPIWLCLWHWRVDDYMIYRRKKWTQWMVTLSRAFHDFSKRALTAFYLYLLQKPHDWSPGYQALSISSLLPHGCWSHIFKAPNWPCHLTIWHPSQESLWTNCVAFIPTQHCAHGLWHAQPPRPASPRAAL